MEKVYRRSGYAITEDENGIWISWTEGPYSEIVTYPISRENLEKALKSDHDAYEVMIYAETGRWPPGEEQRQENSRAFLRKFPDLLIKIPENRRFFEGEELEVLLDQAVEMLTKAENFVLTGIYVVDGYERFAGIKRMDAYSEQFIAHFLEYDEYLEGSTVSRKRREGDVLEGKLFIDLVTGERKTEEELMHRQPIQLSSHIEAVVQVCQVVDNYSVLAMSTVAEDQILVEFEHAVDYKSGDRIYLEGSLELEIIGEA